MRKAARFGRLEQAREVRSRLLGEVAGQPRVEASEEDAAVLGPIDRAEAPAHRRKFGVPGLERRGPAEDAIGNPGAGPFGAGAGTAEAEAHQETVGLPGPQGEVPPWNRRPARGGGPPPGRLGSPG